MRGIHLGLSSGRNCIHQYNLLTNIVVDMEDKEVEKGKVSGGKWVKLKIILEDGKRRNK